MVEDYFVDMPLSISVSVQSGEGCGVTPLQLVYDAHKIRQRTDSGSHSYIGICDQVLIITGKGHGSGYQMYR